MDMTNTQELELFRLEIVYMCEILLEFLRGWKGLYWIRLDLYHFKYDWQMAVFINVMWTM